MRERQLNVLSVQDLDVTSLKKVLGPEAALVVHEDDALCQTAFGGLNRSRSNEEGT